MCIREGDFYQADTSFAIESPIIPLISVTKFDVVGRFDVRDMGFGCTRAAFPDAHRVGHVQTAWAERAWFMVG